MLVSGSVVICIRAIISSVRYVNNVGHVCRDADADVRDVSGPGELYSQSMLYISRTCAAVTFTGTWIRIARIITTTANI